MRNMNTLPLVVWGVAMASAASGSGPSYPVVGTGQTKCYDNTKEIACPASGQPFHGQDGQRSGVNPPSYQLAADGLTVYDNQTHLTWQRSPDANGDGSITASDKLTWAQAQALPAQLNAARYGGYDDWRLPSIKELYSLINFSGGDPAPDATGAIGLTPFIDTHYFKFAYGQLDAGERIIDSQYASSNLYVYKSPTASPLLFGVNFADGRIKGYGLELPGRGQKTFFVQCVRGNEEYGKNQFSAGAEGAITDASTGLMWARDDSGAGRDWQDALAWVQARNAENYLGHNDWRMPTAKELHSILDYTRSPDTTGSAAIDPVFHATSITNEAGQADYPYYWTGTTHARSGVSAASSTGGAAVYIAFGRALGFMDGSWTDVHGAGAQRSDPKSGVPSAFPTGNGPQGDAIRILNFVRLVRTVAASEPAQFALTATGQNKAYDNSAELIGAVRGDPFYGQDAHYKRGAALSYRDNGDGTVADLNTGLTWQKTPALNGFSWQRAQDYCTQLTLAGTSGWRAPSLKELFSISDFETGWPYLDTTYFSLAGRGVSKDEQYWSTEYYKPGLINNGSPSAFGVNHGTGHIKAYPADAGGPVGQKHVRCVRGDAYGANRLVDNADGTITDAATGLMWMQEDSGKGMDWLAALGSAQASDFAGHHDWRVPNVKELQSIVDYSRTSLPAIDPLFHCTQIVNEAGKQDYGYYWTSTSAYFNPGDPAYYFAWYVAFGRAVGPDGEDVHGAGAVRFDTKVKGGPAGEGGERINNYVRLVRDVAAPPSSASAARFVNGASLQEGATAPGAILTVLSDSTLADGEGQASAGSLPTKLAGTSVEVSNSQGVVQSAGIHYASPHRINLVWPLNFPTGGATVTIRLDSGSRISGDVMVEPVAPGLFTQDGGVAVMRALRLSAAGQLTDVPVYQYDDTSKQFVLVPIDLGKPADQVYLLLYGTGIRGFSSLTAVTATIGGVDVPISGAGASSQYAGLDQVNLGPLPRSLAGKGTTSLVLGVDGRTANSVAVNFQ